MMDFPWHFALFQILLAPFVQKKQRCFQIVQCAALPAQAGDDILEGRMRPQAEFMRQAFKLRMKFRAEFRRKVSLCRMFRPSARSLRNVIQQRRHPVGIRVLPQHAVAGFAGIDPTLFRP